MIKQLGGTKDIYQPTLRSLAEVNIEDTGKFLHLRRAPMILRTITLMNTNLNPGRFVSSILQKKDLRLLNTVKIIK